MPQKMLPRTTTTPATTAPTTPMTIKSKTQQMNKIPKKLLFSRAVYNNTRFERIEAYWVLRPRGPAIPQGRVIIEAGSVKQTKFELDTRLLRIKKDSRKDKDTDKAWKRRKQEREKELARRKKAENDSMNNKTRPEDKSDRKESGEDGDGDGVEGASGEDGDESCRGTNRKREMKQVLLVVKKESDMYCAEAEEHLVEGTVIDVGLSEDPGKGRNGSNRGGRKKGSPPMIHFPSGSRI